MIKAEVRGLDSGGSYNQQREDAEVVCESHVNGNRFTKLGQGKTTPSMFRRKTNTMCNTFVDQGRLIGK